MRSIACSGGIIFSPCPSCVNTARPQGEGRAALAIGKQAGHRQSLVYSCIVYKLFVLVVGVLCQPESIQQACISLRNMRVVESEEQGHVTGEG